MYLYRSLAWCRNVCAWLAVISIILVRYFVTKNPFPAIDWLKRDDLVYELPEPSRKMVKVKVSAKLQCMIGTVSTSSDTGKYYFIGCWHHPDYQAFSAFVDFN